MNLLFAISENAKQSGLVALKMIGGVIAAAVILYLVLLLTRKGGSALEKKKYDRYVEEYNRLQNHNVPLMSYEEFVLRRSKGEKIKAGLDIPTPPSGDPSVPQSTDNTPNQQVPSESDTNDETPNE